MALDTTVGGANADSYASLAELETYMDARVPTATLDAQTDAVKEAAMRQAARMLDAAFDWTGAAVDSTQALVWPRSGMATRNGFEIATTVIPTDLKEAQCELAVQVYAANLLADNDARRQGITSVKAGSVAVSFQETDESTAEAADIAIRKMDPDLAWASRQVPDAVRLLIPKSWYRQHSIRRPFMFGAM